MTTPNDFNYCPETGAITRGGKRRDFSSGNRGQRRVKIDGEFMCAHRLAWYLHHGTWPTGQVDHINHDAGDNRISNLRECSQQLNQFNTRKHCDNTSGEKNVTFDKGHKRWQVRVKAGALLIAKDASHKISAILAARLIRRELHGSFACNS